MKKTLLFLLGLLSITTYSQTSFAGWSFDAQTTTATSGVGTLSFVGGTGPATYINNSGTQALAFANFPLDGTASGTAGIQFATSTVGKIGVSVTFDTYGHNQSSRWQRYEYTTDGVSWTILSNNAGNLTSGFLPVTLNFPAICDEKPNFAFRIVSIFNPAGGTVYEQVQGGGYNGNNGKWYFDNIAVKYSTLGRSKFDSIQGLKIYPNPAKNLLNINSDSYSPKTIVIYNILGDKVLETQVTTNHAIAVDMLKSGVYMVKVIEEGKIAIRKLVVE